MQSIHNLSSDVQPQISKPARKQRRFLVGKNEVEHSVKAIPKLVSLHVTRLKPNTCPGALKAVLEPHFPDVQCEQHTSKYPESYSSMKVTISRSSLEGLERRNLASWSYCVTFFNEKEDATAADRKSGSSECLNGESVNRPLNKKSLNVYYQNTRGLRTKTETFYTNILSEDYDIIAVTESWLTNGICNSELVDDRYTVVRKDREAISMRGGGVFVAIKKDLKFEIVNIESRLECLYEVMILSVVYFPPNSSVADYTDFYDMFDSFNKNNTEIIIVGDFNLPDFENNTSEKSKALIDFCTLNNLVQYNDILNFMSRKLDLVLANFVAEVNRDPNPLVNEDNYHPSLTINFSQLCSDKLDNKIQSNFVFDYSKGNFKLLYEMIKSNEWSCLEDINDVDCCLDAFYEQIYSCPVCVTSVFLRKQ
ncbi:hypothetical protein JTB14_020704 [Gonioctena quinquepunctata]|nr:hypothetical protein JTB14_020704 [Gonioctena quinquepunctata]